MLSNPSRARACLRCANHGQQVSFSVAHLMHCPHRKCGCISCRDVSRKRHKRAVNKSLDPPDLNANKRRIENSDTHSKPECPLCNSHGVIKYISKRHKKKCNYLTCACAVCSDSEKNLSTSLKQARNRAMSLKSTQEHIDVASGFSCTSQSENATNTDGAVHFSPGLSSPPLTSEELERCAFCLNHGQDVPFHFRHLKLCEFRRCKCTMCMLSAVRLQAKYQCSDVETRSPAVREDQSEYKTASSASVPESGHETDKEVNSEDEEEILRELAEATDLRLCDAMEIEALQIETESSGYDTDATNQLDCDADAARSMTSGPQKGASEVCISEIPTEEVVQPQQTQFLANGDSPVQRVASSSLDEELPVDMDLPPEQSSGKQDVPPTIEEAGESTELVNGDVSEASALPVDNEERAGAHQRFHPLKEDHESAAVEDVDTQVPLNDITAVSYGQALQDAPKSSDDIELDTSDPRKDAALTQSPRKASSSPKKVPTRTSISGYTRLLKVCRLCKNHGVRVKTKGHRQCPYETCDCTACLHILEERRVKNLAYKKSNTLHKLSKPKGFSDQKVSKQDIPSIPKSVTGSTELHDGNVPGSNELPVDSDKSAGPQQRFRQSKEDFESAALEDVVQQVSELTVNDDIRVSSGHGLQDISRSSEGTKQDRSEPRQDAVQCAPTLPTRSVNASAKKAVSLTWPVYGSRRWNLVCKLCKNHGVRVRRKGHRNCPYETCDCNECHRTLKKRRVQTECRRALTEAFANHVMSDLSFALKKATGSTELALTDIVEQVSEMPIGLSLDDQTNLQCLNDDTKSSDDNGQASETSGQTLPVRNKATSVKKGQLLTSILEATRAEQICRLCLNHGVRVARKGHGVCPYGTCQCNECLHTWEFRKMGRKQFKSYYTRRFGKPNKVNRRFNELAMPSEGSATQERPKVKPLPRNVCAFCRNHGLLVRTKGHRTKCQYAACDCSECTRIAHENRKNSARKADLQEKFKSWNPTQEAESSDLLPRIAKKTAIWLIGAIAHESEPPETDERRFRSSRTSRHLKSTEPQQANGQAETSGNIPLEDKHDEPLDLRMQIEAPRPQENFDPNSILFSLLQSRATAVLAKRSATEDTALHSCSECQLRFTTRKKLARHRIADHALPQPRKCQVCQIVSQTPFAHEVHMNTAHTACPAVCQLCHCKFPSPLLLDVHIYDTHSERELKGDLVFTCPTVACHFFAPSPTALSGHVREVHRGMTPFKCTICGAHFDGVESLVIHNKAHMTALSTDGLCDICCAWFPSAELLRQHLAETHKEKHPYRCPQCPQRKFQNPSGLGKHASCAHSNKLVFRCDHCDVGSQSLSYLQKHLQNFAHLPFADPEWMFCPSCDMASHDHLHMMDHVDEEHAELVPLERSAQLFTLMMDAVSM